MTLVSDVPNCQLFFTISKTSNPLKTYNVDKGGWYHDDSGSSIHITMGYHNMGTLKSGAGAYKNCPIPDTVSDGVIERVQAVVQTYCVWTPSLYDGDQPKCKAAGYVYDGGKCTTTHFVDPNWDTNANGEVKAACEAYGFTWYDPDGSDSTTSGTERCQFKYVSPSDINNTTKVNRNFQIAGANGYTEESDAQKLARVAAVCKAAGYKWNGTDCSCPDGTSWDNTEKKCK